NGGAAVPVTACVDGKLRARSFLAERIEIEKDHIRLGRSMPARTTIGGILVTVNNPGRLPIASIDIAPRHGGKTIRPTAEWPFFFQRSGNGRMRLNGAGMASRPLPAVDLVSLVSSEKLQVHLEGSEVVVDRYQIDPQLQFDDFGPVLCWTGASRRRCFELAEQFLMDDQARQARVAALTITPGTLPRTLGQKDVDGCKQFNFDGGIWVVRQPVVFDATCEVRFFSGAALEFTDNSFLILKGTVHFPEASSVEFRPYQGATWGGVVLWKQPEAHVQYATFKGGNEFVWNGRRFTGALNIIGVKNSSVYRSAFLENKGDDGLNVRGGHTKVHQNEFRLNRDALDIDLGDALVENNLIVNSKDDGIDLGSAQGVVVRFNIIAGSGDKGISIGEGSKVEAVQNLFIRNNIGLANKDGSSAVVVDNYFTDNMVGLMAYNKVSQNAQVGGISGRSVFNANGVTSKIVGPPEAGVHVVEQTSDASPEDFVRADLSECAPCQSHLKQVLER
ncbi:hypothetical protein C2U70_00160, partial [Bradyrhizobium guangdongense]|uniref:right-handed parallel beta-helix repeat-containing protein n=1 Tax=Bradyrhizobium guangdongense TaxID=1325090 RepID=UPI00112A8A9C